MSRGSVIVGKQPVVDFSNNVYNNNAYLNRALSSTASSEGDSSENMDIYMKSFDDSINDPQSKKRGRPRKNDEEEQEIVEQVLRKRKYARNYRESQRQRLVQFEQLKNECSKLKKEMEMLKKKLNKYEENDMLSKLSIANNNNIDLQNTLLLKSLDFPNLIKAVQQQNFINQINSYLPPNSNSLQSFK